MNYLVKGNLIGGFGLVAYPAEYGNSGVMTFIVNHSGVVFQKDLGPKTDADRLAHDRFRSRSELDQGTGYRPDGCAEMRKGGPG